MRLRFALTCAACEAAAVLLPATFSQAQIILSSQLSSSPAVEQFVLGKYDEAYRSAARHLDVVRRQGNATYAAEVDVALAAYGAGLSKLANDAVQNVLSKQATAEDRVAQAIALHLRSDIGIASPKLADRMQDLLDALRILESQGGVGAAAMRADVSLAILIADNAPKEVGPLLERLDKRTLAARYLMPRDQVWLVLGKGQVLLSLGRLRDAEPLLRSAARDMQQLLGSHHPDALYASHYLGFVLRQRGNAEEALPVLQSAWEGRRNVLGPSHPQTLRTAVLLARQLRDMKRTDEALELARMIEVGSGTTFGSGSAQHLSSYNAIAEVLLVKGDVKTALDVQEPAFRTLSQIAPNGNAFGEARFTMGQIYARMGRYQEAEDLFEQTNRYDQARYPPTDPMRWTALNNIAVLRAQRNDRPGQIAMLERIESEMSKYRDDDDKAIVQVRTNLAAALVNQPARVDDGVAMLQRLVSGLETHRPPTDLQLLRAESHLGAAYVEKQQYENAIALHTKVRDIRVAELPEGHPDVAASWYNLAYALDSANRSQEALRAYLAALDLDRRYLGIENPSTIRKARAAAGLAAGVLRDYGQAQALYREAVQGAERIREYGQYADWLRQAQFRELADMYKNYSRVLGRLGQWESAFRIVDLSKARTLRETTHRQLSLLRTRVTEGEAAQVAALQADVARLSAQIAFEEQTTAQATVVEFVDASSSTLAQRLSRERDGSVRALASLHAQLERKYGWQPVDNELDAPVNDAKHYLASDSVFVNFSMLGDAVLVTVVEPDGKTSGRMTDTHIPGLRSSIRSLRAVALDPGGLSSLNAGSESKPAMALWRLRAGGYSLLDLATQPPEGAVEESTDAGLLEFVSNAVLSIVPQNVWRYTTIVVSPDAELTLIPFEMLRRDGRMLVEHHHQIVYSQSWSMYRLLKKRDPLYRKLDRRELLAVGDPVYTGDQDIEVPRGRGFRVAENDAGKRGNMTSLRWRNLPGATKEMDGVADLYRLTEGRDLFRGAKASEQLLSELQQTSELARYRMILFSAHGYLDSEVPDRSSVVLSQYPRAKIVGDGYVTAAEWKGMSVRSDLIFLSACDTGVGQIVSGEGVLGLPLSMFAAGNQNTVLTLWPIYDESSPEFVVRFFAKVKGGATFAIALAETKREFASGQAGAKWKIPAYWAPFVIYGH